MTEHRHRWGPWLMGSAGEYRICTSLRCGRVQYAGEVGR